MKISTKERGKTKRKIKKMKEIKKKDGIWQVFFFSVRRKYLTLKESR